MSHSQKATSSKTSSHFLVLSNYSLKEGYVDPQSLSIFLKNLDLCASCSEGSLPLLIQSASFHFLMFLLFLTFFPASWCVLLPDILCWYLFLYFSLFFSCFFLSYKFSLSFLSLAHFSYISVFPSLHLITNPILCIFISFPFVAWLPLLSSFIPFPFIGAHLDSCIDELVIFGN